ncbi:MAG: hypothetical protein NWE89_13380 [Candidatus Bathyarchaeota archaeon]|nr:hypothetical protein [Candidatus Bathyarchaeota archaeon]
MWLGCKASDSCVSDAADAPQNDISFINVSDSTPLHPSHHALQVVADLAQQQGAALIIVTVVSLAPPQSL